MVRGLELSGFLVPSAMKRDNDSSCKADVRVK